MTLNTCVGEELNANVCYCGNAEISMTLSSVMYL